MQKLWLATAGICVILFGLVYLSRRLTNRRIRARFEALCQRFTLMGHFNQKLGPLLHPVAMGTLRGRLTRVESVEAPGGWRRGSLTRFSVTRADDDPFQLAVRRNPSGRRAGESYVASGDASFDAALLLRTNDEARAREVLDAALRAEMQSCAALGMSPPGIQVNGTSVAYTQAGLLAGARQGRLAEAMVAVMQDLADRIDATRPGA